MSPLELIGGVIALGLMAGGLKLYQMNRKRPVKGCHHKKERNENSLMLVKGEIANDPRSTT